MQLKTFNPYGKPGSDFPNYARLCVFLNTQDIFFIGFIANSFTGVFMYHNGAHVPKETIKSFAPILNELGGEIKCEVNYITPPAIGKPS